MSRKRFITDDISTDSTFNRLDNFAKLLYMLLILHARDDAIVHCDVDEIKMRVIPGFRETT